MIQANLIQYVSIDDNARNIARAGVECKVTAIKTLRSMFYEDGSPSEVLNPTYPVDPFHALAGNVASEPAYDRPRPIGLVVAKLIVDGCVHRFYGAR